MAQVRFSELEIPSGWPLPRDGLLSVFMGDDEERHDVEHHLVFTSDPRELERFAHPELDEGEPLTACAVRPRVSLTLPGYGEPDWLRLKLNDDEVEAYFSLSEAVQVRGVATLLGRDYDVDELPTRNFAIARLGGPAYDHAWATQNAEAIATEARRWVPLFQMDSNPEIGLNMWDAYTFVVLIRWEDLAAGRFDRTHAQLART